MIITKTDNCATETQKTNAVGKTMEESRVATNLQLAKNTISEKHIKLKLHRMRYAYSQGKKSLRNTHQEASLWKSLSTFCLQT